MEAVRGDVEIVGVECRRIWEWKASEDEVVMSGQ